MLIQKLQKDPSVSENFVWKNDSLWYKDHLFIYVRTPNSNKGTFGIPHLSYRRGLKISENLPQDQEGIFLGRSKI